MGEAMKKNATYYKKYDKNYHIGSRNFQKIIDFYLFCCPVLGRSHRGKTFEEYGWKGSTQFSQLKTKILSVASSSLKGNYHPCKKEELEKNFKIVETVRPLNEYCVFLKSDEKSVMQSLFAAIRNAFAHGSFNVQTIKGEKVYFFANFDGYLKAELILLESTLLEWIEIVKIGYIPK